MIIKDHQTNVTYNFARKGDNVYHTVLLPSYVERRFKDPEILMNEVERTEKRKNSQLLKDVVIALPDDKELDLQDRIAITHAIIEEMAWVKNGLGVQVDIHKPHNGERNWHAHLLITTRRFTEDGKNLGAKAVDLNPEFKKVKGKAFIIPESQMIHQRAKEVMNRYFAKLGLETRVDSISMMPQQHLGPVRMRSIINEISEQNELRKLAHLKIIKDSDGVLNRIISHQAIFSKQDVVRAVKEIQGKEEKQKLIQGVLNSDRLVKLYNEDGKDTKYYTTCDVREEETRLLRIADKIHDNINYNIVGNITSLKEDIAKLSNISESQREALQHILLQYNGIRILRGRAGTGKSQILATAYKLVTHHGQNIIGLSPTHKAVSELKSKGYQQCYTVKGFLFKLYNGKITLPNNSLLVVDEAGMVSNSDYLELFKIARSSNCNVILAGDEKQLTSIERGGMLEIFANTFGSYVLSDIRRQSQQWAREMALCFAKSDIAAGIVLLERHNGLKIDHTLEESMARLINGWNSSRFTLQERLIITVGNQEVDSINQGIRELLKASGLLTGKEYRRFILGSKSDKQYEDYMVGDRILFKATDKELQIENGEFATLVSVSNNKFVAKTDQGREIAFNPEQISFKHGYASTVFKAQGASIKDVYVLHNLACNVRNSYVEMTRHVEQVKLYCNRQATRNMASLISQLARIDDRLASMHFKTLEDLNKMHEDKNPTIINKLGNWFKYVANDIEDRLHNNKQYYQPKVTAESLVKVVEVLQQTSMNLAQNNQLQEGLNNSCQMLTNSNKQERRINTKLQEDIMTNYTSTQDNIKNKNMTNNINYDFINKQESLKLKQLLSFKAEDIAHSLLGRPNELLSNNYILRWEKDGKIAMKIKGSKAGIWYDFSKGEGGDLFTLVQRERKCNFVEAKKYLQEMVGMATVNKQDMLADLVSDKSYRQDKTQNQHEQD
jgi:Ti-type conjugative transfer relaxase TraA